MLSDANSPSPTCVTRLCTMRRLTFLLLVCLGFGCSASQRLGANEPEKVDGVEKIDLFQAGTDGYALYRIPGIVTTKQGTLLAYCEARRTGKSDWDAIDILLRRSVDGGKTWDAPRKLSDVPGTKTKNPVALAQKLAGSDDITYNNPLAIVDDQGTIHLLFCLEYMRCFIIQSRDDGKTWSPPREITQAFAAYRPDYAWQVLATGPGHGIQLASGRLLVPVWLSLGTGGHAHRPSVISTIYSDDAGQSWRAGQIAVPNNDTIINPSESAVVQLADGRVMLNARSESLPNRRLATISPDGIGDWSTPQFVDDLNEPICMASLVRWTSADKSQSRLLFCNPNNLEKATGATQPGKGRDRKNLSLRTSADDGKSWSPAKTLEAGFSGYSDLAVLPDGTIVCFYERGSVDSKSSTKTGRLTIARIAPKWLDLK